MRALYAAAVPALLRAGWPGVLPLPAGCKHPPPAGWTGREAPWPDADQHAHWARDHPDGNIALRLPPAVVGIDVDAYKPQARTSWARLSAVCGPLPATWMVTSRTDSSGIRLYRVPVGVRWAERHAGPGIELIHAGHRYVVVAPSMHPEGRRYRWITPAGTVTDQPPSPGELPPLPASWGRHLTERPTSGGANPARRAPGGSVPVRAGSSYAAATVAGVVADLRAMRPGDGRNRALNRAAYALGGLVGAGLVDEPDMREVLVDAARANGYTAKVGEHKTLAIIDSGLRAGAARPRAGAGR